MTGRLPGRRATRRDVDGALPGVLRAKLASARAILGAMDGVVVAYSGGVDSSVLAFLAHEVLGDRALACTAVSAILPRAEREGAIELAERIGIRHRLLGTHELKDEQFVRNTPDRCYVCKGLLFAQLRAVAEAEGLQAIVYGANTDDERDYRPGARSALEAGVRAPLAEAGLGKDEVRAVARAAGLPNADKPAAPCLASRIPYGIAVTPEALRSIERAELALRRLGFGSLRVRHHQDVARVELPLEDLDRAAREPLRSRIVAELRASGYRYVALDLAGFRSGSLNAAIDGSVRTGADPGAELPIIQGGAEQVASAIREEGGADG